MQNKIAKNIFATLCYYDVMDYPLTIFEIWKYAFIVNCEDRQEGGYSLREIMECIESVELKNKIDFFSGYYFLFGRKKLVLQRIERNKIAERKYKRVRYAVKFLRFMPFVQGIFVTGRVAMKNAESGSDLDLLVVLKKGHIFTGRLGVTGIMQFLGLRRHKNKIASRICLNHFVSDEFNLGVKDIFSRNEYAFMSVVFKPEIFLKFYQKNSWISNGRTNYQVEKVNVKVVEDWFISKISRIFFEWCLDFLAVEKFLQKIQTRKIIQNNLTKKPGALIIYTEDELAFWPNFEKQGPRIFEEFQVRLTNFQNFAKID